MLQVTVVGTSEIDVKLQCFFQFAGLFGGATNVGRLQVGIVVGGGLSQLSAGT